MNNKRMTFYFYRAEAEAQTCPNPDRSRQCCQNRFLNEDRPKKKKKSQDSVSCR